MAFSVAHADDPPVPDVPTAERAEGAPPPGHVVAPGITVSGYGTLQLLWPDGAGPSPSAPQPPALAARFDDPQYGRRPRLDVSHLSGIAWWEPAPAWKVLGEVDLQDVLHVPRHRAAEDGPDSAPYAALDRLYVDYRFDDAIALLAGKFLTPIGRWNQEHSDPETWTVLRPLLSESAFPVNATGAMLHGSLPAASQWVDYQAYASGDGDWRSSPHAHRFQHAVGGRISTALNPDLRLGVSFSRFVQDDYAPTRFDLWGVDGSWRLGSIDFSGEAITRHAPGGQGDEHGWFLQSVVPVVDRWWAVGRIEAYRRAVDARASRTALLGAVYRSGKHWVFKAEWAQPSGDAVGLPSGLLASLTLVY